MRFVSLLALSTLLLAACATPDKIRQKAPKVFENQKPAQLVAACLAERYDGMGFPRNLLEITPRGDGGQTVKRLVQRNPTIYLYVIDISPSSAGSTLRLYENQRVVGVETQVIESCGAGRF